MKQALAITLLVGIVGARRAGDGLFSTKCPVESSAEPDAAVLCAAIAELPKWVDDWDYGKPIVFSDAPSTPEFPWSETQSALAATGDPRFDPFEGPVPEQDLKTADGPTVSWSLIESARLRSQAIGVLARPACGNVIMVDDRKLRALYKADIVAGWRRFWRRFPKTFGTVQCSAPGYDASARIAVVSCSHVMGALQGVGVFMILSDDGGTWRVTWSKSLWVA